MTLTEAINDLNYVDPREFLWDDPAGPWHGLGAAVDLIGDRGRGQDRPIFETESDLAAIRAAGRCMARTAAGAAILENLANYTLGGGFAYTVAPRDEADAALAKAVQVALDEFRDANDWATGLEREAYLRACRDGESFLALEPGRGVPRVFCVEPSSVCEPSVTRDLEAWLGCGDEFVSSWAFGVHVRQHYPERPLGYYAQWDESGRDWDYLPAARVEHLRRNVDRNVVRGVSDFYAALEWLQRAEKLLRNTSAGAAIQAAIAFIREHSGGTTSAQGDAARRIGAWSVGSEQTPAGSRARVVNEYKPGTVLDVRGAKYTPGPLGSERAGHFIDVIQSAMRMAGVRWSMPEYMISGDASNGNYASTLVAESPFTQGRKADQRSTAASFRNLSLKALALMHEAGRFHRFGLTWSELRRAVEVKVTPPEIESRDRTKDAAANEIEHRAGVLSARTWAERAGLDYDAEVAAGAKLQQPTSGPLVADPEPASERPAVLPRANATEVGPDNVLNGAQVAAATSIVTQVAMGQLPRESGIGQLKVFFNLTDAQAAAVMGSAGKSPPVQTAESRLDAARRLLWEGYP